jgi:hypothetical protein
MVAIEKGGFYETVAMIQLASYEQKTIKVAVVPVGSAALPSGITAANLQTELNNIYNPIGIKVKLRIADKFDNNTWDNGLKVEGSGLFTSYSSDMKNVVSAYENSELLAGTEYVLFYLPKFINNDLSENTLLKGFMPRNEIYGFLNGLLMQSESLEGWAKASTHELGHGVFQLKHTFDSDYGFSNSVLNDNLMNFAGAGVLSKFQWDAIHDQGLVLKIFENQKDGSLEGGAVFVSNLDGTYSEFTVNLNSCSKFLLPTNYVAWLTPSELTKVKGMNINEKGVLKYLTDAANNKYYHVSRLKTRFNKNKNQNIITSSYSSHEYVCAECIEQDATANTLEKGVTIKSLYNENTKQMEKIYSGVKATSKYVLVYFVKNVKKCSESIGESILYNNVNTLDCKILTSADCNNNSGDGNGSFGDKYIDELARRAGTGNENITDQPGSNRNLYDYSKAFTQIEKDKIFENLKFTQENTGVKCEVYIVDYLTTPTIKSNIQTYIDNLDGKRIVAYIEIKQNGEHSCQIKVGNGISGYNSPSIASYIVQALNLNIFNIEGYKPINFNPITAILDGLAGLLGKLEIPERFYNPDAVGYNETPCLVYGFVSGKTFSNKLFETFDGENPNGGLKKYNSVRCDFAMICGVWNGAKGLIQSLPSGASFLIKVMLNEENAGDSLLSKIQRLNWAQINKMISNGYKKYTANPCMISYSGGQAVFVIASFCIGVGEIGAASDALNFINKIDLMGQAMGKILTFAGKVIKPVMIATGKSAKFVFKVSKAFFNPTIKISKGLTYVTLIPITDLTPNLLSAYNKAKELLLTNKAKFEQDLVILKNEKNQSIRDNNDNILAEIEVELTPGGAKEKVQVLLNEDEARLYESADEMLDGDGKILQGGIDWSIFSKINMKISSIDKDGWLMGKYVNGELKVLGNTNVAQKWDYIVTSDGQILVGRKHSWLSQGSDVLAAGELKYNNGKLVEISNASGHYRPTTDEASNFLKIFRQANVKVEDATLTILKSDGTIFKQVSPNAADRFIYY